MSFRFVLILFLFGFCSPFKTPQNIVPNFTLLDTEDKEVEFYKLMETKKLSLLFFGYSHCPNVCYNTIHKFDLVSQKLDPYLLSQIEFLFISIDPKEDHKEALLSMKQKTNPSVHFLRGSIQETESIKKAFHVKVYPSQDSTEPKASLIHSTTIFVVDKNKALIHKIPEEIASDSIVQFLTLYFQNQ
jgi:cytochrome oxidase Cu insertion factor (SCO1/SenC/PrrC family)